MYVLNAHGETEEAVVELLGIEILPLIVLAQEHDKALVVPEGHGRSYDLKITYEFVVRVMIRLESEGQYAAEAGGHLLFCHIMSLVTLKSRIGHKADAGLLFKPLGHGHGVFVVLTHTQRQRYRAAHDEPGVKRTDGAAQVHLGLRTDLIQIFRFADDGAAHGVTVAVDILCKALDSEVRAKLDRPLVEGRGKGIVHTEERTVPMGDLRDGGNVRDHQGGVARRFYMNELGVGADGRLHIGGIGSIHNGGLNAEFVVEQLVQEAVDRNVRDA